MNKNELMRKIQETGFAIVDCNLFLDSHPDCSVALEFFAENQRLYKQYVAEFEKNYGPLTVCDADASRGWQWIQGPWPWELEA